MSADPNLSDDDEVRAAELAFGLVDRADRETLLARQEADPAFAAVCRRWQDHAATLLDGPEVTPRPSLWGEVERRLPGNDLGAAPGRLGLWKAATLAASVIAIVMAGIAARKPAMILQRVSVRVAAAQAAPLVAVLIGKDRGVVTITFDPATGRLTSATTGLLIGDHSPELWVIPADGKPRSLGVIASSAPTWIRAHAPARPAVAPGTTLALSIEPHGGSPTGQPTGPVILSGKVLAT